MATAEAQLATEPSVQPPVDRTRHRSAGTRLLEAFEAFEQFPVFASVRGEVIEARTKYRQGVDLTGVIESDLALTVAVLRRANDGIARKDKVATVPAALARIGNDGLQEIVDRAPSFDLFEPCGPWRGAPQSHRVHALATQSAAARLASALAYPRTDELFVAALLHDVGKLVLAFAGMRCSDDRGRADRTPEGRIERERSETGVDHALVGGVLARRWGLPQSLAYAIERHHRPGEPELAGMVRLADMIAHFEAGHAVNGESMLAAAADVGLSAPALRAMLAAGPGRTMQRTLPSPLTPGEQRIIAELAKGKVYKQIAHTLDLSVSTVRTHLYNSYRKLGVPDRAHAVMLAKQHGWV